MPHLGCSNSAFSSSPGHDYGVIHRDTFKYFIPSDHAFSFTLHKRSDLSHKPTLKIIFLGIPVSVFQTKFSDFLLTFRTGFPSFFHTLITSEMNVFAREQFADLIHYIFEQVQRSRISGTQDIPDYAPSVCHLVFFIFAAQLGICCQNCGGMSRKVNFRNYLYISFLGICHNLTNLFLSIEPSVAFPVRRIIRTAKIAADNSVVAPRSNLSQFRMALDFNSPSLVVSKMPMEYIELVKRKHINGTLHHLNIRKMPADIEHKPPVSEAGPVGHFG